MGYTTEFEGSFTVSPPLNEKEIAYLEMFSDTRRMDREKGPYFVGGSGEFGQGHDTDITNFNAPAEGQPSLWCQWVPSADGSKIEWDGNEKFYCAAEWIQYLIDHFFGHSAIAKMVAPDAGDFLQAHDFGGHVDAMGEERGDNWSMEVIDGQQVVTVTDGKEVPVPRQTLNLLK